MRKNPKKTAIFAIVVFNLIYDLEFYKKKIEKIKKFIVIKFSEYFCKFVNIYSKMEFDQMFFNRFFDY